MNKAIVILALTLLALAGASASMYRQLHAERERVQVLQRQVQALRTRTQPTQRAVTPFSDRAAQSPEQAAEKKKQGEPQPSARVAQVFSFATPTRSPAAVEPDHAKIRQRFERQQQALMNDPEYRTALRKQQRFSLVRQYPDLVEDLGITKEQADQLLDLLADQQLESMQDANRMSSETLESDQNAMAEYQRKMMERHREHEAAIAEALGKDGLQRWQEYQSTMGSRFRTRQLAQALDAAGIPLREDQRSSVRRALAQHEKQMQQEAQTFVNKVSSRGEMTAADRLEFQEQQLARTERYYERARDSVAGILSAEQLEQYKNIHEQELAMQRAALRVQRAQLESNGGESDPSGFAPFPGAMIGTAMPAIAVDE